MATELEDASKDDDEPVFEEEDSAGATIAEDDDTAFIEELEEMEFSEDEELVSAPELTPSTVFEDEEPPKCACPSAESGETTLSLQAIIDAQPIAASIVAILFFILSPFR